MNVRALGWVDKEDGKWKLLFDIETSRVIHYAVCCPVTSGYVAM